jgi:hypothetical protein
VRHIWKTALVTLLLSSSLQQRPACAADTFAAVSAVAQVPPAIDGTLKDPDWQKATPVKLGWDYTFRRSAEQETEAYVLADAQYIYVAFVARQKQPITATQHTNDQPLTADDTVGVYFWPAGENGNEYAFIANPAGTRYATSGENSVFAPRWDAVAKTTVDGYIVTERIPVKVMRGDGRALWRLQFDRHIRATNQILEWAHSPAQTATDQNIYSGYLRGMDLAARNARTKPRLALYGLGEVATQSSGGSTSRAGADLSVPFTQTSSFVATFHPDYSNVELDQQTIAPTAFPRQYAEVRPFFTQGSKYINRFSCDDCVDWPLLYTPNIPTPRTGYEVEGVQGNYTYDAFDAIGAGRIDEAQAVSYTSTDRRYRTTYQRVAMNTADVHDVAQYAQIQAGNAHNFSAYLTQGRESGTGITLPGTGAYREYSANLFDSRGGLYVAYHDVGSQYAPVDAFNTLNDLRGPTITATHEFDNDPKAFVQTVTVSHDYERYHDHNGLQNYGVDLSTLAITTRNQWSLQLTAGHTLLRFPHTPGGYTNQNGVYVAYGANTSSPSSLTYNAGRFGGGFLQSTDLLTTVRVTRFGTLSLEAFNTNQRLDTGGVLEQWLERISFGYQLGGGSSVAAGWRRIIGAGPTFYQPAQFIDATNLSLAYYRRMKGAELYLAYGTPNTLNTQHDVLLKLIRYIGAEKGT